MHPAISLLFTFLILGLSMRADAAIGCSLSNPAQDLKFLFPSLTSYREEARNLATMADGQHLFQDLKTRLGSDLDPVYETYDTPYTIYRIYQGEQAIGIVHGVNVPGRGGVIQIFLAVDVQSGEIRNFFFQRLESPAAAALKKKEFRQQFIGLTLADFYKHDYFAKADPDNPKDRVARIAPPAMDESGRIDYQATLHGIRKNLILLDLLVYERKFEPFFERAQQMLHQGDNGPGQP